jgi:hypothetical protein
MNGTGSGRRTSVVGGMACDTAEYFTTTTRTANVWGPLATVTPAVATSLVSLAHAPARAHDRFPHADPLYPPSLSVPATPRRAGFIMPLPKAVSSTCSTSEGPPQIPSVQHFSESANILSFGSKLVLDELNHFTVGIRACFFSTRNVFFY